MVGRVIAAAAEPKRWKAVVRAEASEVVAAVVQAAGLQVTMVWDVFEVETPIARLTLSYRHRARRWTIDGMDHHRAA